MSETISFVDLRDQHEAVRDEIETAIRGLIDTSRFVGGPPVATFEKEFAEYIGVKEAVGCGNGTDALWLALEAAGIGNGDAVITQPNTFIATVEAITRTGAYPLFVDIDLDLATISAQALRQFIAEECRKNDNGNLIHKKTGKNVAAIIPVHLYGLPSEMNTLLEIANSNNLLVFEDAAQAHGAQYLDNGEWKKAGNFGLAAGFSFYPGKNLGAMGEAGAIVTNDPELAEKMRWLRDHGSNKKYIHPLSRGWNARLDSIQAVVLSAKLKMLDKWNESRRQAASYYSELLADLPLNCPVEPDYAKHVYHLYVIRTNERDHIQKELNSMNIQTGLHYPIPIHLQDGYAYLDLPKGSYPYTEESARTILSLPMHQALTYDQIQRVHDALANIFIKEPS
jgi:dTDP-4-amino-4,6-dideoxygalactose transaminase